MKVIHGNNLDVLKQYPENYFDAIVTDPPYGLGKEPDAVEVMQSWVETGYHEVKGGGFMGKEWDAFVPQPLFWKEVFRVLKPGGHVLAFYGTRTYDWGVMAMRFAGFEVRDTIYWHYGSGFPKSHNIGKAVDKLHGAEREVIGENPNHRIRKNNMADMLTLKNPNISIGNSKWEGWGSALKPASEPIVLARKPLEKGLSIAENVLKWGTGGINIDGSRVKTNDDLNGGAYSGGERSDGDWKDKSGFKNDKLEEFNAPQGRFPANLVLSHHPECECKGMKKVKGTSGQLTDGDGEDRETKFGQIKSNKVTTYYGSDETVEDWECHPDCPIKILDEQSGERKGWATQKHSNFNPYGGNSFNKSNTERDGLHIGYDDKGGASRFFPHLNYDAEEYNRFLYTAKASKSERNKGLEGFEEKQAIGGGGGIGDYLEDVNSASGKYGSEKAPNKNFHPTVKPVQLMRWLVRLVTPPNGIVLDPFCGSGTTGIACKVEGFDFVGIEQDADYCKIAESRIENWIEKKPVEKKELNKEPETNYVQTSLF